ncbi:glycosyltransferase family 4 protein [Actinomycetospora sp. OC33-EN08]|uniref:Glycosyltransferase family 4 protein n=1 Tax=Actinomycetospora aurantiaca TaxID=3129233 RepID=A0ABU8MHH1_9PSEU
MPGRISGKRSVRRKPTGVGIVRRLDILLLGLNYAPERTGIAPYTTGMARAWADAGHRVHVVTGYPHYPQWRVQPGFRGARLEERDGDIRITRVRHPVPNRPTGWGRIGMEAAFAAASLAVRTRRPDVVVAVSPALLTVAAALWRRRWGSVPLGVVVQDLYGDVVAETGVLGGRGGRSVARVERSLLSRADGIVAVHDMFRGGLARAGVPDGAVTVIGNWTHTTSATGDPAALRHRLGWPVDRTIALHAGNMGAKQGLENVVAAARLAEQRELPVRFVLLGDGNQRPRLAELGADCTSLEFLDPLPDGEFETALAAADVLVLNERETVTQMCVPSKLTSYFAAGRPVVAATSATSPAGREMGAAAAGIVVEPGRPELLLEAAVALGMGDGAHLGQRGREYAAAHYSAEASRAAYLAWVTALAEGRRSSGGAEALEVPRQRRRFLARRRRTVA